MFLRSSVLVASPGRSMASGTNDPPPVTGPLREVVWPPFSMPLAPGRTLGSGTRMAQPASLTARSGRISSALGHAEVPKPSRHGYQSEPYRGRHPEGSRYGDVRRGG